MKVYNRKGLLLGGIWMLLALWNLVHDFGSPDPNTLVQVRDSILSVFLLLLGITFTLPDWLGTLLILSSVILISMDSRRRARKINRPARDE